MKNGLWSGTELIGTDSVVIKVTQKLKQGEWVGHITPNLLLQFDLTANVWVSRCASGATLINVIIKECLFYFFKHLRKYTVWYWIFSEKITLFGRSDWLVGANKERIAWRFWVVPTDDSVLHRVAVKHQCSVF